MRVFLALTLPLETARVLARKRSDIEDVLSGGGVVWVPPANYHVTLKYFGEQSREFQYALRDVIEPLATVAAPLNLTIDRLGTFPVHVPGQAAEAPRILWAGLKDAGKHIGDLAASRSESRDESGTVGASGGVIEPGVSNDVAAVSNNESAGALDLAQAPSVQSPSVQSPSGSSAVHSIVEFAEALETMCSELGCERAIRTFHPHVTMARCKASAVDSVRGLVADTRKASIAHSFEGRELTLYESRLRGEGAEYRALWRMPLGQSTSV